MAPVACGRVAARLARQVEVGLSQVDLSLPQYRILMFLDEGATVPPSWPITWRSAGPPSPPWSTAWWRAAWSSAHHHDVTAGGSATPSPRPAAGCSRQADRNVDARLREIAAHLDDEAQVQEALAGPRLLAAGPRRLPGGPDGPA